MLKRAFSSRTCLSALSAACRRARWTISEEAIVGHRTATVPALSNFLMISGATCTKRHHFMNNWTCSKKPVFRVNVVHAVFWGFTPNKGGSRMFHACFTRFHAPPWPSCTCLDLSPSIPLDTVQDTFLATFTSQSSLHTAQRAPVRTGFVLYANQVWQTKFQWCWNLWYFPIYLLYIPLSRYLWYKYKY